MRSSLLLMLWVALTLGSVPPRLAVADEPPAEPQGVPVPAEPLADEAGTQAEPVAPDRSVDETLEKIWNRETLFGDVWGLRPKLHDRGIDVGVRLSQYYQAVSSGGVDQNSEYGGTWDYRVNADLNKLLGTWKGLSVEMHARTRFGKDVLADAGGLMLPNTGLLMQLPGDYRGTDITGLTLNQMFPLYEGHMGLFTVGQLDIIDAVTLFFPYVGYGQEGFWNVQSMVSALPWFGAVNGLSLYGGWLASINEEHQMGQSAFLLTGTENVTTNWGSFNDSFDDGVWMAAFHRFLYKLDDKPGYFMIFGGYSTRDQPSNDPHDHVIIPGQGIVDTSEDNPWDVAVYLSQDVWHAEKDPSRKAMFMIGGTAGPDNPQFARYNFFTHLEAYGPMASRPHDRMGVAFWRNWLSDEFTRLVSPVANLHDMYGFELYYNIQINPWLHLTADLQFLKNANKGDSLAVVPGVRLVWDF